MKTTFFFKLRNYVARFTGWVGLFPFPFTAIENWYSKLLSHVPKSRLTDINEFFKNGGVFPNDYEFFVSNGGVVPKSLVSEHQKFLQDGGNDSLSSLPEIKGKRVVLLGGYLGDSTEHYLKLEAKQIVVFEPIAEYFEQLANRFSGNPRVQLVREAAWIRNETLTFSMDGDGTGLSGKSDKSINVQGTSLSDWLKANSSGENFFMEMNIEGSEYPILNDLISTGALDLIETLLVQFHDFTLDPEFLRAELRQKLRVSHSEVFNYPWIWEKWSKK